MAAGQALISASCFQEDIRMAKKSFISQGNPALQFISAQEDIRETVQTGKPAEKRRSAVDHGRSKIAGKKEKTVQPAAEPAERVVQVQQSAGQPETVRRPVAPRRQGESKSKRVQLLVPPSLHMKISRKAASMDMSFNEYVNQVLERSLGN